MYVASTDMRCLIGNVWPDTLVHASTTSKIPLLLSMSLAQQQIACLQMLAPQASRQASVSSFTPGRPSNTFKPDFTIHLVSA